MIVYEHVDNTTIATFATCADSKQTDRQKWYEDYCDYFNAKLPLVDTRIIRQSVYDTIKNINNFNGIAKCSPEDKYSYKIGEYIAKERLLNKYIKYREVIACKIKKEIWKDYCTCVVISNAYKNIRLYSRKLEEERKRMEECKCKITVQTDGQM